MEHCSSFSILVVLKTVLKTAQGPIWFHTYPPCTNTCPISHVTHFRKEGVLTKALKPTSVFLLMNKQRHSCSSLVSTDLTRWGHFSSSISGTPPKPFWGLYFSLLIYCIFSFKLTKSLAKKNCGHCPRWAHGQRDSKSQNWHRHFHDIIIKHV